MKKLSISFSRERRSEIVFFRDVLTAFQAARNELRRGALLAVDEHVYALYHDAIHSAFAGIPICEIKSGETSKSEKTLFSVLSAMAKTGLERNSCLIGLGGGATGDLSGLAASLYMRGVEYLSIPTTLLAQTDASVGGKTAINFFQTKNLVGSFYPPKKILICGEFLKTLKRREIISGLGEIIKHGALCPPLFETLCQNRENLFNVEFLKTIVPQNVAYKVSVVKADTFEETGAREKLNLGHTTAHALEAELKISHGESVLCGLLIESGIARKYFSCDEEFLQKLERLIRTALLRSVLEKAKACSFCAAARDKKNSDGKVCLIVPVAAGNAARLTLSAEEYRKAVFEVLQA